MEASKAATEKAKNEIKRQKALFLVAEKSRNNALNDNASLSGRFAVVSTREAELSFGPSEASSKI